MFGTFSTITVRGLLYIHAHRFITITCVYYSRIRYKHILLTVLGIGEHIFLTVPGIDEHKLLTVLGIDEHILLTIPGVCDHILLPCSNWMLI